MRSFLGTIHGPTQVRKIESAQSRVWWPAGGTEQDYKALKLGTHTSIQAVPPGMPMHADLVGLTNGPQNGEGVHGSGCSSEIC